MTKIKVFENLAYLQAVRNDHLNPLIRKVEDVIVPLVERLDVEMHDTFKNVTLTEATKTLRFDRGVGGYKDINLTPIMPEFPGIGVQNGQGGGPSIGIKRVLFQDATVTINTPGDNVSVGFDWPEIFTHNQKWPEAVIKGAVSQFKSIVFTGDPDAVKTDGTNVTLRVPKADPLMVAIPEKGGEYITPRKITSIDLEGEIDASSINGEKLTINLKAGGGGGTVTNQNFKGFFETLGDLVSKVTDPLHGKSFAYVKDSTLGGSYYTAYFYVNTNWTELKQDPALTYNAPSAPTNQGVFSIKPSDKIKIDHNGQLDLDGLSTPQLPQYFEGFFDTLDQLKAEVRNPVLHQSFAFVKSGGRGWITYRADAQGSASMWSIVAPLGSFTFVDDATQSFTQVFGIKKNDAWEVDSRGLLNLKGGGGGGPGGALSVSISDYNNQAETHDVTAISFSKGKGFAEFTGSNKDHVLLDHPQRVINYNATFEAAHNDRNYEGNIFYDETSRAWMGWGIPDVPGAVDKKWTRIAHPHMSEQVNDLVKRVPAKSPSVTPGIIGDNRSWDYNGVTFLEKDNNQLPDELQGVCGGYITTSVQDKDAVGVTIPQYRIQSLTADREQGGTFVRRFVSTGSPGSQQSWSKWVRTSFSEADIAKHSHDPNAHKETHRFYTVNSLAGKISDIQNQTLDNIVGALRGDGNFDVMADNYGFFEESQDYGTVPYEGHFAGEGVVEFSGYDGSKCPVGKWSVIFRIKKKGEAVAKDLYKFYHTHINENLRYPPIKFTLPETDLVRGDEVYMYLNFDNPVALKRDHPDLYIVPVRSYVTYQDSATKAGNKIAGNFRKYFGNVDVNGEVAVKVHHRDLENPTSAIRVYGTRIERTPTDMKVG
ncbi:MAG: hypothetical protein ACRC6V_00615 [Bacteroidales bacterium]